jgi:Uma2 family endonuclease
MAVETAFRSDERFTQEEFWDWLETVPASDLHRYELLGGRIVMTPPAGWGHGYMESTLQRVIASHVHERGLGRTLGSSAGYDLPTGDTFEPDFSFISNERWGPGPKLRKDGKGFLATVPNLVVEILSPSTARRDRTEKKDAYEQSGVDSRGMVVSIETAGGPLRVIGSPMRFDDARPEYRAPPHLHEHTHDLLGRPGPPRVTRRR